MSSLPCSRRATAALSFFLLTGCLGFLSPARAAEGKIEPRVLVIATYESGKDTGDVPGELQFWAERHHLGQAIAVPGLDHPVLTDGHGLYAMVSGTTSRCAVALMTLALDPRFDLTHTYFLLSGIAGADPARMSLASAAWIQLVVDGDPAFEIDSRETPAAWPYGLIALGATEPGKVPPNVESVPAAGVSDDGSGGVGRVAYRINPSLVDWAYGLTKDVALPDSAPLQAWRGRFGDTPEALRPPHVLKGASLGADRFWHGPVMNRWAQDWVRLYTRGEGALAMSDCEDQGICLAMRELARLGRVDFQRFLILRTASNYTVPPKGVAPEKDLFDGLVNCPAYVPSLDANERVGGVVAAALLKDWAKYRDQVP